MARNEEAPSARTLRASDNESNNQEEIVMTNISTAVSNVIPFSFGSNAVRAFADASGEPWFAANDVCAVLGYRNPSKTIGDHCRSRGVTKRYIGVVTGKKADGSAAKQTVEAAFINEGNLYRLIIKSRKPEAEQFEQRVMEEILPAIRKTGTYTAPAATLTPAQQRHIQNRVAELAGSSRKGFSNLYRTIKDEFGVGTYKDVPASKYPALCKLLLCNPLEGEWLAPAQPAEAFDGVYMSGDDLYKVWFLARHFNELHKIFKESNLYAHLTGLGSQIGHDMIDHFKDGSFSSHSLLSTYAKEMDAYQRRNRINHYR